MLKRGDKKGQVTIFIILAIVVVVLGSLIYFFYDDIKISLGLEAEPPKIFLENCLNEDMQTAVDRLSLQGGYLDPQHYVMYSGEKVPYLCYTNEYYKLCVMQQPMLKQSIETQIEEYIQGRVNFCLEDLKTNYENAGYEVQLSQGETKVELLPKRIATSFSHNLVLKKGENTQIYGEESGREINIFLNNNIYELISIANSILATEAIAGDTEITTYMDYYHDLKVEKKRQSDGTKIYILTDRNTGDKFMFATRSLAFPPGYGLTEVNYNE